MKMLKKKSKSILKELFGTLPDLRGVNLRKIRKELEGKHHKIIKS